MCSHKKYARIVLLGNLMKIGYTCSVTKIEKTEKMRGEIFEIIATIAFKNKIKKRS